MARPTKLTGDVQAALVQALAAGNTRRDACRYAGVSDRAVRKWLAAGRKAKRGKFRLFRAAILKAESDAVVRNVALIQKAAQDGTWQASAWWLSRRYPEQWGRRREYDVHVRGQLQHQVERTPVEIAAEDLIAGLTQLLGPAVDAGHPPDPPPRDTNGVTARPRGPLD